MKVRKIIVLGDEEFDDPALELWMDELPEDTILLPAMRERGLVRRMRFMARRRKISVMVSMSYDEKWKLATEVVVFGELSFSGQERAAASNLPWEIINELPPVNEADSGWVQLDMFEV